MDVPELKEFFEEHPAIYEHCCKLHGSPRQTGQHPAGIAVLPFPVTDLLPVVNAKATKNGFVGLMAQTDKVNTETLGAVKLDVLKLESLTILNAQNKLIQQFYNTKLDLNNLPLDDSKTWDTICSCDTFGVFQFEAAIGKQVLTQVQPRNLEELSACNAFIRPGTSGLDEYCMAKKNASKSKTIHPIIDKILAPTYGAIVYQEEVMSLISELMGISFGKADIFRRAIEKPNKKGNVEKVEEFKTNCVEIGVSRGIDRKACEQIKQDILNNAGYLFNKSHSIAYSYITFETAYVKTHYPLPFYTTLINAQKINKLYDTFTDAKKHGIKILSPGVNSSVNECIIEDINKQTIRIGLNVVKGLGEASLKDIIMYRPYTSINDFLMRAGNGAKKNGVIALIDIGAMEELPLVLPKYIVNSNDFKTVEIDEENIGVMLNRTQQSIWFNKFIEVCNRKTTFYAIPKDIIKGRILDMYENLTFENDDTLVIPNTKLEEFEFTEEEAIQYKTRKRAKGCLQVQKAKDVNKLALAFKENYAYILHAKQDFKEMYLRDLENFEISFIPHVLEHLVDKIPLWENLKDRQHTVLAGLITNLECKTTKTNKPYFVFQLLTPRESIKCVVWDNIYKKNANVIKKNNAVKIKGIVSKEFSSFTVDAIAEIK